MDSTPVVTTHQSCHTSVSQSRVVTSSFHPCYELHGCFSILISFLMLGQRLLCSQLRACDLVSECEEAEKFLNTTHWIHGKPGEPSWDEQKPEKVGEVDLTSCQSGRSKELPPLVAGYPRAPAGSPWALVPPLLPVTPKMVPEHQLAKPLCPCPRQQGLARAGVWSLWLPCWEEVPGRQKISKTNIPEISMDEKFSVNDSQWFSFVSFVFLFHLDGNFVVFLLRKREPWLTYYTADFIHFDSYITSLSLLFSRKWWVHESPETPALCGNWRNTISSYLQNDRLAIIYECSLLGKQFCKDHLER